MGAINPDKMPKAKTITRKDDPNKVEMYAKGGRIKKFQSGGKVDPRVTDAEAAEAALRNYNEDLLLMDRSEIPSPQVQEAQRRSLYERMVKAAPLGYKPSQLPGKNYGIPTPKEWQGTEQLRKKGGVIKSGVRGSKR